MKVHVLSKVFYIASLFVPVFNSQSGEMVIYGGEALLLGVLLVLLFFSAEFSLELIILAIPWVANFTWLISIVLIERGKGNSNIAKYCSYLSLVGALIFFINPKAFIGASATLTSVSPMVGSYLWLFALILPSLSLWLADKSK